MRSVKLIVLVLLSMAAPLACGQGGNPPASTKESGQTSGRGETAVEQTAKGSTPDKKVSSQPVHQALIALDKRWGEAGSKGDTASLNKILADDFLAVGPKGEALGKHEQIAATNANLQNASYTADEYKFEMLTPDVVVMTHRATTKGTQDGKEVTESHRSLHVFQKRSGQWQVVANAQLPIAP